MRASSYAQRDGVTETRGGSMFTGVVWGSAIRSSVLTIGPSW